MGNMGARKAVGLLDRGEMKFSRKEVMLMKQEYILLLLNLIEKGLVSSITVSKTLVIIRIKKQ